jgi:micrococcal nuclease
MHPFLPKFEDAMKTLLPLLLILPLHATAADKVISIQDGDTLTVLRNHKPLKLRLNGIDAPEETQGFGDTAKQSLSDLCFGKRAVVEIQKTDQSGSFAKVICDGVDASRIQVERGLAWVRREHPRDKSLMWIEAAARAERRGLWADAHPVPPWNYHKPEKTLTDNICHMGPQGKHYTIVDGRRKYGC